MLITQTASDIPVAKQNLKKYIKGWNNQCCCHGFGFRRSWKTNRTVYICIISCIFVGCFTVDSILNKPVGYETQFDGWKTIFSQTFMSTQGANNNNVLPCFLHENWAKRKGNLYHLQRQLPSLPLGG